MQTWRMSAAIPGCDTIAKAEQETKRHPRQAARPCRLLGGVQGCRAAGGEVRRGRTCSMRPRKSQAAGEAEGGNGLSSPFRIARRIVACGRGQPWAMSHDNTSKEWTQGSTCRISDQGLLCHEELL